jgi:hypothetical protein
MLLLPTFERQLSDFGPQRQTRWLIRCSVARRIHAGPYRPRRTRPYTIAQRTASDTDFAARPPRPESPARRARRRVL